MVNMKYGNFLENILSVTSRIANRNFGKVFAVTREKNTNYVVTQTDLEIGQEIIAAIKSEFPSHNIIDEETGLIDNHSSYTWVIDPIDGTSNFANGVPTYGIMVGLLFNERPIAGGIALPYFQEIYLAEKDCGAFCSGQKIHVTEEKNLNNVLLAYCIDGHQEDPDFTEKETATMAKLILNVRNIRTSNSAFDAVMVARGAYGAMINQASNVWDCVPQQILIEEAGGIYTDYNGKVIDYTNITTRAKDNFTRCFGAPAIHEAVQAVIKGK